MILEAKGLTKEFGSGEAGVVALRDVSFRAAEGEFVAITGPSGSGKSTLLALLAGLERPSSGEVWVDGRPLSGLDDAELSRMRRHELGFVFQTFNLVPVLTLEENVALPFLLDGRARAAWSAEVIAALEAVGLGHRRTHLPDQVSVGERQRAAIARALAQRPRILFADEPTGSLDSQRGATTLQLLRLATGNGCTVVMVTHDPVGAASADRAVRLRDGAVEEPPC